MPISPLLQFLIPSSSPPQWRRNLPVFTYSFPFSFLFTFLPQRSCWFRAQASLGTPLPVPDNRARDCRSTAFPAFPELPSRSTSRRSSNSACIPCRFLYYAARSPCPFEARSSTFKFGDRPQDKQTAHDSPFTRLIFFFPVRCDAGSHPPRGLVRSRKAFK